MNAVASDPVTAPDTRLEESTPSRGASTSETKKEQPADLRAKTDNFRMWKVFR